MPNNRAQDYAVQIFQEVSALPGYEPVDEDTAIRLVRKMTDLIDALLRCKDHCLCERNRYGFDYGEVHSKLGKPAVGKRWLTPEDIVNRALPHKSTAQNATEQEG